MRTICALLLAATIGFSQMGEEGKRLLAEAKGDLTPERMPEAERLLRLALVYWAPVERKPPEYLEAVGLLGIVVENRLYKDPEMLRTELEPILETPAKQFLGFPGRNLMAAKVLEVYGILLQRTGRESEAKPIFAQAKALRFPPTEASSAFRVGGGVSAPALHHRVECECSEDARLARQQGAVVLFIIVDENGHPTHIRVLRNLGLGLDEKAVEAVQKWVFRPGEKEGVPVSVQATIEV